MEKQLRGSHFVLGRMQDNPASIYTKDYTRKEASHDKSGQGMNPFRTSSLSKNFKMGEDQYLTTNRVKYPEWKNYDRACLDQKTAKQLKKSHFNLGNYSLSGQTTNKYYHNLKPLPQTGQGFAGQKSKMRGHNHDFKQGPVVPLASVYNQQFNRKQQSQIPVSVKNNQIRKTHIILGKEQTPMVTTNTADYSRKQFVPVDKAKIPNSKLVLGTNTNQFKTTNQVYHQPLPFQSNALPVDTMKQLRATHFQLGGSRPNYSTQSNTYQAHPVANTKPFNPALQRTSKSIAPDGKFYGQTTNNRQLPKRQLPSQPAFKRQDFTSGWKLGGNQPNVYATQSSSNYRPKVAGQRSIPIRGAQQTFELGTDKIDYTTTNRANFSKKQLPTNSGNGGQQSNLRGHHFNFGQSDTDKYITVYQDQYRQDQQNKSKLFHRW